MTQYKDAADMSEDDCIALIVGELKKRPGGIIGVAVYADHVPGMLGKADRYVSKIIRLLPRTEVVKRIVGLGAGELENVTLIQFLFNPLKVE